MRSAADGCPNRHPVLPRTTPLPSCDLWISQARIASDNVYYVNSTHNPLIYIGMPTATRHCDSSPGALNASNSHQSGDLLAVLALELPAGPGGPRSRAGASEGL